MKENACTQCARRCKNDRSNGRIGYCGMPNEPVLAKACLHYGEEPCISGKNGSGTVFFSGCSMKCVFCQNYNLSHDGYGKKVSVKRLSEIFKELENKGAHNINLVTPSHYAEAIASAIDIYRPSIPIVYNSGGYESPETMDLLKDVIDVYLIDFKFFDNNRAIRYASAPNYREAAENAIKKAYENVGGHNAFDADGMMTRGLIIRHLIMPQGTSDAISVIDKCAETVPNAAFSLMAQYLPMGDAENYPEINRRITRREYRKVSDRLAEKSFPLIYGQELLSATDEYIPDFDLEGV